MPNSAKNKIIIAVDAPNAKAALKLVDQLSGQGCLFKIGLQLFTAEGPSIVREIQARGARVFLDLKREFLRTPIPIWKVSFAINPFYFNLRFL